ncbi:MAG: hypothetical protein ABI760_14850, partial [Ferruginibacter sp.]
LFIGFQLIGNGVYIIVAGRWGRQPGQSTVVGGDTNQGNQPWSVSPPTTAQRQFEMYPIEMPT